MMRDFEGPGRSLAVARNGMAATSHPAATLTAIEILKAGGNAMDAAVAAVAMQSVVESGSTGIGGDCFSLFAMGDPRHVRAFNGSGRTPAALTRAVFDGTGLTTIPRSSPYAVTVPGAVDAWCRLVGDFGRMSMAEILQPAIAAARDGYPLTPRVAFDLSHQRDLLAADPTTRATFLVDGAAPAVRTVQRQPLLAETLEIIAREGARGFYQGPVAGDIVDYLRGLGGLHTRDDFAAAAGEYVTPISTSFRGRTVYECPPNGQGLVALLILNILERFPAPTDPFDPESMHVLVEACRLAYQVRDGRIADPDFANLGVEGLLSEAFADRLAGQIVAGRAIDPLPVFDGAAHTDTVYLCVVDRDRNAVSFINSIFSPYGSGLMSPRSGVLLQNRGQGFSLAAGHPNVIGPRKRPMHTIIPGMVAEGGRVIMPFGVMGGHYQAMGQAHLLSRVFDCGLDLQTAIDLPRLFPFPGTKTIEAERGMRARLGDDLTQRGFAIEAAAGPIGGAQAIRIDWERGVLLGGSDPRKDGLALGY